MEEESRSMKRGIDDGSEPHEDMEEPTKRQRVNDEGLNSNDTEIEVVHEPRFMLEKHPDPVQRRTYGTEHRCLIPKPFVIISNEKEGQPPVLVGNVSVSLVDYKGKEILKLSNALKCEKGLTQNLERLRNDSPTVWSHFSIKATDTSGGEIVRLLFQIDYVTEDDETVCLRERLFSKPFEIIAKKKTKSGISETTAVDSPPKKVRGEGSAVKVIVLESIPVEVASLLDQRVNLQAHDLERPFRCTFSGCDKSFKRADHMRNHLITHTPALQREHQCKYCKRDFALKHQLDRHEKLHERAFRCDFEDCTSSFDKENLLIAHKRKHLNNMKMYECEYPECELRFTYPSERKKHMQIHEKHNKHMAETGTPLKRKNRVEYICTEEKCGEVLGSKDKLRKHLKEAHNITKEVCPLCGESFALLEQHLIRGHKMERFAGLTVYFCEEEGCLSAFDTKGNLTKHINECHQKSEPSFFCDLEDCKETFYHANTLKNHQKKTHPDAFSKRESKQEEISMEEQVQDIYEASLQTVVDPMTLSGFEPLSVQHEIYS